MVTHKPVTLTIKGQLEQWDVAGAQCLDLCDFFCINLIKFMFIFKMMDTESLVPGNLSPQAIKPYRVVRECSCVGS